MVATKKTKTRRVFEPEIFTRCFHRYQAVITNRKRFVVVYGGANSSKSYSVHQSECLRLLNSRIQGDVLVMRKVATDLRESCYKLIKNNYTTWGYEKRFHITYSGDNRAAVNKLTGRQFTFRGCDDVDKLKSFSNYSRAIVEEADQITWEDFKQLDKRVRHPTEFVQIILILNPVSEDHWIKTKLIDGDDYKDRVQELHCTYHDNEYASADDILANEATRLSDPYWYQIYVLGMWGQVRTGLEYIYNFKYPIHVGIQPFVPGHEIHLAFDLNVNPYVTMLCYQVLLTAPGKYLVNQFDEFCLPWPRNSIESAITEFIEKYQIGQPKRSVVTYYGDAMGNSRIEGKGDERRFDDIEKFLGRYTHNNSDQTNKSNPRVIKVRDFMNNVLAGKYYVSWLINPKCVNTITDYQKLRQAKDGHYVIEYGKNEAGDKYEKCGHCYDASVYFAHKKFSDIYQDL